MDSKLDDARASRCTLTNILGFTTESVVMARLSSHRRHEAAKVFCRTEPFVSFVSAVQILRSDRHLAVFGLPLDSHESGPFLIVNTAGVLASSALNASYVRLETTMV